MSLPVYIENQLHRIIKSGSGAKEIINGKNIWFFVIMTDKCTICGSEENLTKLPSFLNSISIGCADEWVCSNHYQRYYINTCIYMMFLLFEILLALLYLFI